jgi:IS5 family transposase
MAAAARKLKELGLAVRTTTRDRTRSVRRRAHAVAAWLRRRNDEARDEVLGITGELADIADLAVVEAQAVVRNARRTLVRRGEAVSGKATALIADLERTAALVEQIVGQTRQRLAGEIPYGATRVVSLHDPDARPIRKGRLGKPVEFGYKAQVVDNADGIVVDHLVVKGNPPDAPMLRPAIERITKRFGRAPKTVTADRGYGEAKVDAEIESLGVRRVAIPRRGKPGVARLKLQRSRWFTKLVKWRTGSEGRVSSLKRDWQLARTLMDGEPGAQTWCSWGILANNLVKISALIEATNKDDHEPAMPPNRRPARPPGSGPPTGPPLMSRTAA